MNIKNIRSIRTIKKLFKLLNKESKNFPKQKYDLSHLELLHTDVLVQFLDVMNIAGSTSYTDETELTDLRMSLQEYLSESAFEEEYPQEYNMYLKVLNHLDNQIDQESEMIYGDVIINIVDSKEKLDEWRKNVFPQYAVG